MPPQRSRTVLQLELATLTTSIGDDLPTSVAAFTARNKNFRYTKWRDIKLLTAPARDIVGELRGVERLQKLLHAAWGAMRQRLQAMSPVPTLFLLALPDWAGRAKFSDSKSPLSLQAAKWQKEVTEAFRVQCRDASLPVYGIQAFFGGAETCHVALAAAFKALEQSPPPTQIVLIAADSLCDMEVLLHDCQVGRIYDDEHSSGWVPGEAAACIVLRPEPDMRRTLPGTLVLHIPHLSDVPLDTPRWPSDLQGDGVRLQQSLDGALGLAGMQPQHIGQHVSDSDGSRWRLEDETAAIGRMTVAHDSKWRAEPLQPAELLGQIGAAWGAVQWALIAGLHAHGLARVGRALCTTQDIAGTCSAGVLECVSA